MSRVSVHKPVCAISNYCYGRSPASTTIAFNKHNNAFVLLNRPPIHPILGCVFVTVKVMVSHCRKHFPTEQNLYSFHAVK